MLWSGQAAVQVLFLICDFLAGFRILRQAPIRKQMYIRRATVKPEEISKVRLLEDLVLTSPCMNCRFLLPTPSAAGLGNVLQLP